MDICDSSLSDPRIQHVYQELRALAAAAMRSERPDHTLQPTALANEAFVRLEQYLGEGSITRPEFVALAAQTVRRVLVDHARKHNAECRGGGRRQLRLLDDAPQESAVMGNADVLALDELLDRLGQFDQRKAQVVQLRFFGGLTVEEVAAHMELSPRSVASDWSLARAWLRSQMGYPEPAGQ